ncbi:NAD(P)/FAD-dependent oxidoreductase, partial [Pseudonocardia sp.]|uniref:NAD(P)/FAD-dependent oxidoreductase n=1 Tax=Pseudonocardia sp. TaxID=60912 RepID=UPI0031FD3B61
MTDRVDVLVVGGSVAGLRTAEALRRFSYPGTVTIHEAGDDLPYDRTTLSKKVLATDGHLASVGLRSREDLDALGIELVLRSRAESLDASRRTVHLDDGRAIEYSTLVVATGSGARELPDVPRTAVRYLRTLADAHRLRTAMDSARRAVVVGAGFIGSEVTSAMSARGIGTTVVEPAGHPLARVLGNVVGARLARLHEARGVRLLPGRAVIAIRDGGDGGADGAQKQVVLDDGTTLCADLVVVGIGARPNTAWLDGSAVEV